MSGLPQSDTIAIRDYSRLETTEFKRERLSSLRVMVVGAGALGNEVIKNLALLGVGKLVIVDRDIIQPSNLTRSILFCFPGVGQHLQEKTPKAKLAARRAEEINPDTVAVPLISEIADVGLGIVSRVDVVFGCLDNELARLELSWACNRLNKPLIDGGLGVLNYSSGLVSIYPGAGGPCYGCRKGKEKRREILQELHSVEAPCWMRERDDEEGSLSSTPLMSSLIAAVQVEMGLRHCLSPQSEAGRHGQSIRISLAPEPKMDAFSFESSVDCSLHESQSLIKDPVRLRNARSQECTVKDLLFEVEGGNQQASLCLDWPITAQAECTDCHHLWSPMIRRARFRNSSRCPNCASNHLVERDVITTIEASSDLASRTLSELGLPPSHIHQIVRSSGDKVHLKISGDLEVLAPREAVRA